MVSNEQIQAWANGLQLPRCIGDDFVGEHGRLPESTAELCAWANTTGRRTPDGQWHCLNQTPKAVEQGDPSDWRRFIKWAESNPGRTALLALGIVWLFSLPETGRRRR